MRPNLRPLLFGASALVSPATLLVGEAAGFAVDAASLDETRRVLVRNSGDTIYGLDGFISQAGTSPKLTYALNGGLVWSPHNMLLRSEDITQTWATQSSTASAADTITDAAANTIHEMRQTVASISGASYTASAEFKAGTISTASLWYWDGVLDRYAWYNLTTGVVSSTSGTATGTIVPIDGWYKSTMTATVAGATIRLGSGMSSYLGTGTGTLKMRRMQINRGTRRTAYLATTTAARYGLAPDYDPITHAARGVRVESAATNLCLRGRDFTSASWTKSTMTTARTAIGADGEVNAASTLTATAGNATALQAITSASAARNTSMFVRRRTGSGNIDMTQDNGSTWATVAVTAEWTRVLIAPVTSADPTVGIRIVASGDAIDVDMFQHETGSIATSPIPTFAAAVTRAADAPSFLASAISFSATVGTLVVSARSPTATGATVLFQIDDGTANERLRIERDGSDHICCIVTDGGVAQATLDLGVVANDTAFKVAFAWAANDFSASLNGAAVVTDVSGTLPTVTTLRLGYSATGEQWRGWIKSVVHLPRRANDNELMARAA